MQTLGGTMMSGIIAGFGLAFLLFAGAIVYATVQAAKFQTILIQMQRAGNLTQAQMDGLGRTIIAISGNSIFGLEQLGAAFVVLLQRGVSAAAIMHGAGQAAVYL